MAELLEEMRFEEFTTFIKIQIRINLYHDSVQMILTGNPNEEL